LIRDKDGSIVYKDADCGVIGYSCPEINRGALRQLVLDSLEADTVKWGYTLRDILPTNGPAIWLTFEPDLDDEEYKEPWVKYGTKLKLREIKELLDLYTPPSFIHCHHYSCPFAPKGTLRGFRSRDAHPSRLLSKALVPIGFVKSYMIAIPNFNKALHQYGIITELNKAPYIIYGEEQFDCVALSPIKRSPCHDGASPLPK
jgi:hypothetical protein